MAKIKIDPRKTEALANVTTYLSNLKTINLMMETSQQTGLEVRTTPQDKKEMMNYSVSGPLLGDIEKVLRKEAVRLSKLVIKLTDQYDIELDESEMDLLSA